MTSDGELLRRYTETNSEDAFAELVRRHVDVVYSAAMRQTNGDAHLAQDVAQSVFADLARKAASLAGRQALAGWLYTGTHYAAAKAVRTEQRRHTREQEAHAMQELLQDPGPNPDWETLRPLLDTAMHELNEDDREVILLRYFENRQHADIGEQFGLSENAARMRVERALERLRAEFNRRGVTTTAVALSTAVSANAVSVAPAGLAATLSTAALAGATLTTAATATTVKTIAMTTLQKTLITATVAVLAGAGFYEARQASTFRTQVEAMRQQQTPLTEQIAQLTRARDDASRQFAALRDENERLNRDTAELLKLRGEVTRLRSDSHELAQLKAGSQSPQVAQSLPTTIPQTKFPKASWAFVGYASPESSLRSWAYAMSKGDTKAIMASLAPEQLKEYEKLLAGKSDSELAAEVSRLSAEAAEELGKVNGYRIIKTEATADAAVIRVAIDGGPFGEVGGMEIRMRKIGNEWKVVSPVFY